MSNWLSSSSLFKRKSRFNSSLILLLLLLFVTAVLFLSRKRYKMFHHLFLAFPLRLFLSLQTFTFSPSLLMMWMICMRCEFNYERNEWMSAKEWMDDARICFVLLTGKIELKRMLGRSSCLWQWRMFAPRNEQQKEEMVISWQTSLALYLDRWDMFQKKSKSEKFPLVIKAKGM